MYTVGQRWRRTRRNDITLVLTELSSLGIAMAANFAVTFMNPDTGLAFAEPNLARKLQEIPYLNAGISCWGIGKSQVFQLTNGLKIL